MGWAVPVYPNRVFHFLVFDGNSEVRTFRFGFAHGIAKAFRFMHHELGDDPVIHRDLQPANVLVDARMRPKVADFGESRRLSGYKKLWAGHKFGNNEVANEEVKENRRNALMCMTVTGGPSVYMAPEILNGERFNMSVDVYSYSLVLLEILQAPTHTTEHHHLIPI